MALGAQRTNILNMVLTKGICLVAGRCRNRPPGQLRRDAFYWPAKFSGVSVTDPWTFGAVAALVTAVGVAAGYLLTRHAMRVDPMVALRYE